MFDAFAEETGFLGAAALLAVYLLFVYRGMLIALRAPTEEEQSTPEGDYEQVSPGDEQTAEAPVAEEVRADG